MLGLFAFGAWSYYKRGRSADKNGNDVIYIPNKSGKVKENSGGDSDDTGKVVVEFLEARFRGDYSGDTDANGVPDGMGEFSGTYSDSDGTYTLKYTGGFKNGVFSGMGKSDVVYANGDNAIYSFHKHSYCG